ncbi:hypothetical protein ACH424_18435 [Streptomyces jumonjinensis]
MRRSVRRSVCWSVCRPVRRPRSRPVPSCRQGRGRRRGR